MARASRSSNASPRGAKPSTKKTKTELVASKSPKKPGRRKGRGPMNNALVKRYAAEIEPALGQSQFDALFAKLMQDSEIGQSEAVALTSIILEAPVTPSTARGA